MSNSSVDLDDMLVKLANFESGVVDFTSENLFDLLGQMMAVTQYDVDHPDAKIKLMETQQPECKYLKQLEHPKFQMSALSCFKDCYAKWERTFPDSQFIGPLGDQINRILQRVGTAEPMWITVELMRGMTFNIVKDSSVYNISTSDSIGALKGDQLIMKKDPNSNSYIIELDTSGIAMGQDAKVEQAKALIEKLGFVQSPTKRRVDIIKAIQEIDNEFFAKLPRFEMKSVSTDVFPGAKLSDVAGGVKLEQREDLLNEMGNLMVKVKSRQPKMSSRVLMWERNNKGNNLPSYVVNTTTNKVVGSGIGTYGMKVLPADAKNKYPDGTLLICESKVPEWLPKGSQFECLIPYKRLTEDSVAVRNLILAFIAVYSKDPSAKTNFCRRFNQFSIFGTVRDSKKVDAYKKTGQLNSAAIVALINRAFVHEAFWGSLSVYAKTKIVNQRLAICVEKYGQSAPVFLQVAEKIEQEKSKKSGKKKLGNGKGGGHEDLGQFLADSLTMETIDEEEGKKCKLQEYDFSTFDSDSENDAELGDTKVETSQVESIKQEFNYEKEFTMDGEAPSNMDQIESGKSMNQNASGESAEKKRKFEMQQEIREAEDHPD